MAVVHPDLLRLAPILRARRLALGISQQEVANRAKVQQSSVSDWEKGKNMQVRTLAKWCEVLGLRLELKLGFRDDG